MCVYSYLQVYFIWVTASQRHFEWLIDILKQVEDTDVTETIQTHIFITQFFNKFDLRTSMLVRESLLLHVPERYLNHNTIYSSYQRI